MYGMGEKMNIGVFQTQLNRVERFEHWRENETFAAQVSHCRQAPGGCRQQILENSNRELQFMSLSTADIEVSTCLCSGREQLAQSIDRGPTKSWVGSIYRQVLRDRQLVCSGSF